MKTTIWGTPSKIGEVAREDWPDGRLRGWHSFNDIERELPATGVPVDVGHAGPQIGVVVYGEIAENGSLNIVAVVDDNAIAEAPPIYFSGSWLMHNCDFQGRSVYVAERAEMIGLAVTKNPGTIAAKPIMWRAGDIRCSVDRGSWPIGWRANDLLAAAVDWLETFPRLGAHERVAKHLVDRRPHYDPYANLSWSERREAERDMQLPGLAKVAVARQDPERPLTRSGHR